VYFSIRIFIIKIIREITNITFNAVLLNCINNTQMNKNINILKSHCINFIFLSPRIINFALLVYPKFKDEIHKIEFYFIILSLIRCV
jgi:hypothetical protein